MNSGLNKSEISCSLPIPERQDVNERITHTFRKVSQECQGDEQGDNNVSDDT